LTVVGIGTGTVTYQWYSNTVQTNTGGTLIVGATVTGYSPPSATLGTLYYYATVTSTCGTIASSPSGAINISVAPAITAHPSTSPQTICLNVAAATLTITASGATSYQWYSNTVNNNTTGSLVSTSGPSYTPPTNVVGTRYYYAKAIGCLTSTSNTSGAVTVNALTAITAHPSTAQQNVCQNAAVTPLTITANGLSLTYQLSDFERRHILLLCCCDSLRHSASQQCGGHHSHSATDDYHDCRE
jgi:hypothetical protein